MTFAGNPRFQKIDETVSLHVPYTAAAPTVQFPS